MASQREMVDILTKDLKSYTKNINVFSNSLNKLDNKKFKKYFDINNEIKQNFENEIKKNNTEKEQNKKDLIKDALTELKYKDNKFYFDENFKNICDVNKKINEKVELEEEEINQFYGLLTSAEENMRSIPLYPTFVKSQLFHYLKEEQKKTMEDLKHKFKIERSQIYCYINFYNLIAEYNFLLKINLSFRIITRNIKRIKEIIASDEELKKKCENKLDIVSIEKRMQDVSMDEN
jgi:uncharacterized membrane protein (GlpM family)